MNKIIEDACIVCGFRVRVEDKDQKFKRSKPALFIYA